MSPSARPTRAVTIVYGDPGAPFARIVVAHAAPGFRSGRSGVSPTGMDHWLGLDAAPDAAAAITPGMAATMGVDETGRPTYLVAGSRLLWTQSSPPGDFMARAYYKPIPGSRRSRGFAYFAYGLEDADTAIEEAMRSPTVVDDCAVESRDVLDLAKDERSGEILVWFWYADGATRRLR